MRQHFQVIGSGHVLPSVSLSAEMVDDRVGQPRGWTRRQIGVLTRYVCADHENLATMGRDAVLAALDDAQLTIADIDLLIDASTARHQPIPSNGPAILRQLSNQASGLACMDVHHTCLSFVTAMHVANGLLGVHAHERILILSAEACSLAANWDDAESACLLGDGAAAVILERVPARDHFAHSHQTFPQHYDACGVRGGAHMLPAFEYTPDTHANYRFHMDGRCLMRVARQHLPEMFASLLVKADVRADDLHVIPHQASPLALRGAQRWLNLNPDRFYDQGVVDHGNIGAAGIPLTLDRLRRDGLISRGDRLMFLGTAAGYSQAGIVLSL